MRMKLAISIALAACLIDIYYLMRISETQPNDSKVQCSRPNQVYRKCGCPLSCKNNTSDYRSRLIPVPQPDLCADRCVTGCQCDDYYYDDGQGNCVEFDKCPNPWRVVCPEENETMTYEKEFFWKCAEMICDDIEGPRAPWNRPGAGICMQPKTYFRGCICKPGYVRISLDDPTCINITDCPNYPPKCSDPRKEFKLCGSSCEPSCDYIGKPEKCMDTCISACFCKAGFVMDYNGSCIYPHECPPIQNLTCPHPNQDRLLCGPWYKCHPICNYQTPRYCHVGCKNDCYCKAGYSEAIPYSKVCVPTHSCNRASIFDLQKYCSNRECSEWYTVVWDYCVNETHANLYK